MITIFSIPKAFKGHTGIIQENAINSWTKIKGVEIVLFGDDPGVKDFSHKNNILNIENIEKNNSGTPLVSDAFKQIRDLASNRIIMYSNADIIYLDDLSRLIKKINDIKFEKFVACGQRYDLDFVSRIVFDDNWKKRIHSRLKKADLHSRSGLDYFIFDKDNLFDFPELAVGRPGWDNWFLYKSRKCRLKLVDLTKSVLAIHQNHESIYKPYDQESLENKKNIGGYYHMATLNDANWKIIVNNKNYYFKRRIIGSIVFFGLIRMLLRLKREMQQSFRNIEIKNNEYQICIKCVMDTSDPKISFDQSGVCDHCHSFENDIKPNWFPNEIGHQKTIKMIKKIKRSGKKNNYDCIIGVSGGLDSSFLLHKIVNDYGLRPLVFHVDGGWNSNIAVNNIQVLIEKLNLDLYTEVIDWQDMQDFQLALFKSGTPHLDLAQDHAFFATMYHYAKKHKIKYIINGGNFATEGIRNPLYWLYYGTDMSFLNDIRKKFCTRPLKNYPWSGILYHKVYLRYFYNIQVVKPLNWLNFNKNESIKLLEVKYNWKSYHQKHFESRFTAFYEGYWLPTRFGYDTRRVQFSSLIHGSQMTRDEALKKLKEPSYDVNTIDTEKEYIANKLNISNKELEELHQIPKKWFTDYRHEHWLFYFGARIMKYLGLERAAIKR